MAFKQKNVCSDVLEKSCRYITQGQADQLKGYDNK